MGEMFGLNPDLVKDVPDAPTYQIDMPDMEKVTYSDCVLCQ